MQEWKQNTNTKLRGTIHSPDQCTHVVRQAGCFLPSPSEGNTAHYACSAEALILEPLPWWAVLLHETGHNPSRAGHSGFVWLAPASCKGTPALSACREQGSQLIPPGQHHQFHPRAQKLFFVGLNLGLVPTVRPRGFLKKFWKKFFALLCKVYF